MKYVETHHSHFQKNRFSSFTRFYTLPNFLPHRKCPKFPCFHQKDVMPRLFYFPFFTKILSLFMFFILLHMLSEYFLLF